MDETSHVKNYVSLLLPTSHTDTLLITVLHTLLFSANHAKNRGRKWDWRRCSVAYARRIYGKARKNATDISISSTTIVAPVSAPTIGD